MQDLTLVQGGRGLLRITGGRIAGFEPETGDLRIGLCAGDGLLPGLINAHDHLQLNVLPRLKYRGSYQNVGEWIADIEPRLRTDPLFLANAAVPRAQRLLIGGLKNLLCGVTTVAHHDPLYPELQEDHGFPVRVLSRYGWSHSLALEGAAAVQRSCRDAPADRPWIIHAAEGVDALATSEFKALEALGCLKANTVFVHGVAFDTAQRDRLLQAGAGLVWCPGSNLHLFGRTADVRTLAAQGRVALGSDSRISGSADLLAELHVAREASDLDEAALEALVTINAARLLRLPDCGRLTRGARADLLVLPKDLPLSQARRADVRLVMVGGVPRYADPDLAEAFGASADLVPVRVDGRPKWLARSLVRALDEACIGEPGLETLTEFA